jgi:hypothetical protein
MKQEPAVAFFDSTEEPSKVREDTRVSPRASPNDLVRAGQLGKAQRLGGFLTFVKDLVKRHIQGVRQFLKGLDRGYGVAILRACNVAP